MGVPVTVSQVSAVQPCAPDPVLIDGRPPLGRPLLSVIIPVYNGAHFLVSSITALRASDLPSDCWELIVVDDSSQDGSGGIAARYADRVLRLDDGPHGPAFARNRGAAVARGDALVFVDADVCIHPDALGLIATAFDRDPALSAVFGAYDLDPTAGGLVSQYRNLLHRYVHQRDAGNAVTFWAGCGAVRAAAFVGCGGFNERDYVKASVEDIELGYRLSALGHRIVLRPEIQARHMKRWTLGNMIVTDVRRRGIPWVRLLMSQKVRPAATLNLRASEQVCTILTVVGCFALGVWLWSGGSTWLVVVGAAIAAILAINAPLLAWFAGHRGWWFAFRAMPLRLLYYALNVVSVSLAMLPMGLNKQRMPSR
jgi:cellulose synthase/poly-beta-1,6-N-acetylglucosamine synthase-like glycosyltransferase